MTAERQAHRIAVFGEDKSKTIILLLNTFGNCLDFHRLYRLLVQSVKPKFAWFSVTGAM
jgi:hypothetical protein